MGSVFEPGSTGHVRDPRPAARRTNPAIPGPPDDDTRPVPPAVPGPGEPRQRPQQPESGERPQSGEPSPSGEPPPSPADPSAPVPRRRGRLLAAGVVAGLVAGGLAVGGLTSVLGDAAPHGPVAAPPLPVFSAGVHLVGDDRDEMSAGRYVTAGPSGGASCTVVRLSGLGGSPDEVVAERDVEGPATLRVIRADAGVVLEGPCAWRMG